MTTAQLEEQLAEAHAEHERLLAYACEVRGSRDVHSVYEVLDWQREQLDAKDAVLDQKIACLSNLWKEKEALVAQGGNK